MIFKVYYQNDQIKNPKRESTHSLYIEADTEVDARASSKLTQITTSNSSNL